MMTFHVQARVHLLCDVQGRRHHDRLGVDRAGSEAALHPGAAQPLRGGGVPGHAHRLHLPARHREGRKNHPT